jgi:hypothetical protein
MIRTFWRLAVLSTVLAMASLIPAHRAQAYAEPSIVPQSWDLTFTHSVPRPIAVRDTAGDLQWYWYITYKVVNNTSEDRLFVPEVEISTDEGDLIRSGQNVPTAVFFAIKEKERNTLLESPNQVVGRLLQGNDHARESVIIWPAFKHNISQLTLFIAGLSGETSAIKNPLTDEPVTVRKSLMIEFSTPGDTVSYTPDKQTILPVDQQWIMR